MDKNELQTIVGRNLQRCRANAGLTQEQVAEQAGISTSFYANLERGNRCMSAPVLRALADTLGVRANSLLYNEDANSHIENICALLKEQPAWFSLAAENSIRALIGTLTSANILREQNTSHLGGESDVPRQAPEKAD